MGVIKGATVRAFWYDPRTGVWTLIGEMENSGVVVLTLRANMRMAMTGC